MRARSVAVEVTPRQKGVLEALVRAKSTSQQLAERCRIVLLSADDRDNAAQAADLRIDRQRVRRWRRRWSKAGPVLAAAEQENPSDRDFERVVAKVLADDERSGAPPKFTPEQLAAIIALACEPPKDSGLPVSHWKPPELAREAIKRGIVERISPRHIDRFLQRRTCDRTRASIG